MTKLPALEQADYNNGVVVVLNWVEELKRLVPNRAVKSPGFASSWKAW